jgi:hypothetical protein
MPKLDSLELSCVAAELRRVDAEGEEKLCDKEDGVPVLA